VAAVLVGHAAGLRQLRLERLPRRRVRGGDALRRSSFHRRCDAGQRIKHGQIVQRASDRVDDLRLVTLRGLLLRLHERLAHLLNNGPDCTILL